MQFMMDQAKSLGIGGICFVIDRGFVAKDNFYYMEENKFSLVAAMPGSLLEAQRLVSENNADIRKASNRIAGLGVYAKKVPFEMEGCPLDAHIYFDASKQALDEKELHSRIERLEAELGKMGRTMRATKKYRDYFAVDEKMRQQGPGLSLTRRKWTRN
ncbi:MAG: hypothetical protein FWG10_04165 [Eubacteriaceae bacterium]|nr:hypothetical protein [Eubacteriaceae bacterium]